MQTTIKAIETRYKGCRFRSRLEARWAVFFDAMNFQWHYEPEGFKLADGTNYLPDFYLPRVKMWAEVKPEKFTDAEFAKLSQLANGTGKPAIMLIGPPEAVNYWMVRPISEGESMLDDLIWDDGHAYYWNENRFYTNTGASDPLVSVPCDQTEQVSRAVARAWAARFEFGEEG